MRSSAASIPVVTFEPGQVLLASLLVKLTSSCSALPPQAMPHTACAQVSLEWAKDVGARLEQGSWEGHSALPNILPAETAVRILAAATALLKQEPTVVDVRPLSAHPPAHASWQMAWTCSSSCW